MNLSTLTNEETLTCVDRANPEVKTLAERLEAALDENSQGERDYEELTDERNKLHDVLEEAATLMDEDVAALRVLLLQPHT